MKKLSAIVLAALMSFSVAKADYDIPITVQQLPAKAQTFINTHFQDKNVALAKKETGFFELSYDVIFTDGTSLEFDRNGNWKEVDCKYSYVPEAIIPKQIAEYIKANHPGVPVVCIEKDYREYEVELANRVELTFDHKFRLIDIDWD